MLNPFMYSFIDARVLASSYSTIFLKKGKGGHMVDKKGMIRRTTKARPIFHI
jgi:hypothetical protein